MFEKIRRLFSGKKRIEIESVYFGELGITFKYAQDTCVVEYGDIEEIFIFKVDVFAYDIITIAISDAKSGFMHYVYEDQPCWNILTEGLKDKFCIDWLEYFEDVAFPPFKECCTILWRKERKPGK